MFKKLLFRFVSFSRASINPANSSGAQVREQNRKMRKWTCESMHVREPKEKER